MTKHAALVKVRARSRSSLGAPAPPTSFLPPPPRHSCAGRNPHPHIPFPNSSLPPSRGEVRWGWKPRAAATSRARPNHPSHSPHTSFLHPLFRHSCAGRNPHPPRHSCAPLRHSCAGRNDEEAWRDERKQPLEMLQHPAVNLENLPRNVAGGGGGQIDRQRGDIVGRAEAAHGDEAQQQIVVQVR